MQGPYKCVKYTICILLCVICLVCFYDFNINCKRWCLGFISIFSLRSCLFLKRRCYSQRFIVGNRHIISNYENSCKINTQFIEKEKLQFWPQWRWASVFGRCCWVRVMDFSRPNRTVCFSLYLARGWQQQKINSSTTKNA